MKKHLILFLFIILSGTANSAEIKIPDIVIDREKLLANELQIFEQTLPSNDFVNHKRIVGILLIDAPPKEVWKVLKDWKLMGELMSDVEYHKVIAELKPIKKGLIGQSFIECSVSIPLFDFQYTLDVLFDESRFRQDWRLIKPEEVRIYNMIGIKVKEPTDTIQNIKGFMIAEPFQNGRKTIYKFISTVKFSTILPEFVENYMIEKALTEHMEGIKKCVESHGLYVPPKFFDLPF
jgi:predicted ATP-dependent Lon-type protease